MRTATTSIRTELGADGRLHVRTTGQQPRPMLLGSDGTHARVALVATGSLLHPGDHVRIEVEVAAGTSLEIVEPSGTVAYSGGKSCWDVRISIQDKGKLVWTGQPFVVAEGAEVYRSTTIQLGHDAGLLLREALVLGRTSEAPGHVLARTRITGPSGPLLVEDLDLGPDAQVPGLLGTDRVHDMIVALGPAAEDGNGSAMRLERGGTVHRFLGPDLHLSPLSGLLTER